MLAAQGMVVIGNLQHLYNCEFNSVIRASFGFSNNVLSYRLAWSSYRYKALF